MITNNIQGGVQTLLENSEKNVSLKGRTWIHRGGVVGTWVIPNSIEELGEVSKYLYDINAKFQVIGHTSNLYFKNSFNIDYIIDTRKLRDIDENNNLIVCDCGVPMKRFARYCIDHGYTGYEGFVDLPGTVGGAVVNNSGCFGCCIDKVLNGIDIMTSEGFKHLVLTDLNYSFRNSAIKVGLHKGVITKAYFDKSKVEPVEQLQKRAEQYHEQRTMTQDPPAYNLGSTVNLLGDVRGFRGIVVKVVRKCMTIMGLSSRINAIMPKVICLLYFNPSVAKYISKKRLSCFIWKDEKADNAFPKYIDIMKKLYCKISTEIQIFE